MQDPGDPYTFRTLPIKHDMLLVFKPAKTRPDVIAEPTRMRGARQQHEATLEALTILFGLTLSPTVLRVVEYADKISLSGCRQAISRQRVVPSYHPPEP